MSIKTINASQIREISAKGITYIDDDGSEGFIDFEVCYQNFLKPRLSQEAYNQHKAINPVNHFKTYDEYVDWNMSLKQIGRRNVDGNKNGLLTSDPKSGNPYFVFFTEPPIAIECDTQNEYWRVRRGFQQYGWYTQDMT